MGKIYNNRKFHIRSSNTHLLDILEDNYYMELGAVNLSLMAQLLERKPIKLADFIYYDILNSGIGKITDDKISDIYYQINYLQNMRQRSSTSYFFLTCGVIKYYNSLKEEKFAPIVLIPIELNYQTFEIICSNDPIINRVLIRQLLRERGTTTEKETKYIEEIQQTKMTSVLAIDNMCIKVSNDLNCSWNVTNYLTICSVTYPEFKYDRNRYMIDRSINENNHSDIIKTYFKQFKGILPTNTLQKYVCLKAQAGNNFCVDGRLGTGKTHTIINIMGDALTRGKKVLYINQDLDQTWYVEKKLRELGLGAYLKSLTYNKKEEIVYQKKTSLKPSNISQNQVIDNIDEWTISLEQKIHGFSGNYIFETLTNLKNNNPKLSTIDIEQDLEKHEVMHIYETLQKIEKKLSTITPFEDNLWKNLQISSNNILIEDLIDRTKTFYDLQIEMNTFINSFCKKFKLNVPTNITDLYRFTTHLTSFNNVKPLLIWKNEEIRETTKESLNSIRTLTNIYNNLNNYYHNTVTDPYKQGTAKTILKGILGSYLKSKDTEFVDLLIKENNNLENLVNDLKNNIERLTALISEICSLLDIKSLPDDFFEFLNILINHFENDFVELTWYSQYLNDFPNFRMYQREMNEHIDKFNSLRVKFNSHLTNSSSFSLKTVINIPLDKNFEKTIKEYFSFSRKLNSKQKQEIINTLKEYIFLGKEINTILNVDSKILQSSNLSTYEEYWQSFIDFFAFVKTLNEQHSELFKVIIRKCILKTTTKENILRVLQTYKTESYQLDSLITKLNKYNLHIEEEKIDDKIKKVKKIDQYLQSVLLLKSQLRQIFLPSLKLSYSNLETLINNDEKYIEVHKKLEENSKIDKEVLGEYYQGFDTDIVSINETILHLEGFLKRLKSEDDYDTILEPKTFNQLLENIDRLNDIYNDWFIKYRSFSTCFKGGQSSFQDNPIQENVKTLQKFINHLDEIETMVYVIDGINEIYEYKLITLIKHIKDSKLIRDLSDKYLYSVLTKYKEQLLQKYPVLNDISSLEENFKLYVLNEENYCNVNLNKLHQKTLSREGKIKSKKIQFNDYEKLLEETDKFTQIFIADLNVFNSNLELNRFDMVLLDDVHLANSNQYNRINETKQAILFGDSSFATSVTNNLMQRIENRNTITYSYRYVKMTHRFSNDWDLDNCYIYSPDFKIDSNRVSTFDELAGKIVKCSEENPSKLINVLVNQEDTRRNIYTSLANVLKKDADSSQVLEILQHKIKIINTSYESVSYGDHVFIYYNDYYELYPSTKISIFRNYVVVGRNIHVYYLASKNDRLKRVIEKDITSYLGQEIMSSREPEGIVKTFANKLKSANIKYENGFGSFDLYIKLSEDKNLGIMIIGKNKPSRYSLLEEYIFFHDCYQQNNWQVKVYYALDLINNMDSIIKELKKITEGNKNETNK